MRPTPLAAIAVLFALVTACGDNRAGSDVHTGSDAGMPDAAAVDGTPASADGIAAARAAADGTGLSLAIRGVTVTYLKPQIGSETSDPAGFTIQAARLGPALFVAVDPATLTPPAAVGDVVDFTITAKATVAQQPRAEALASYTRTASGTNVGALAQDLTAVSDVVTAVEHYDSELVTVTGGLVQDFTAGGTGFQRAAITTIGIAANTSYQLRAPVGLLDALDMVKTCQFTVTNVPMARFNAQAQIGVFASSDVALRNCPAPTLASATPTSATSLVLTFSRHILPSSVVPDGSQFTFDNGLTASAATVSGRTVTLTTSAQDAAAAYTLAIAATVTDLQGTAVAAGSAAFGGFHAGDGTGASLSVHTTLGIPSPTSTSDPNSYLSVKAEYVVSYNSSRKVPNWVSWELNTHYLGSVDRQNDYRPDDTLPPTLPQAQLSDYSGSGFERGHMCPSADRTLDATSNSHTFYLTNMVPQSANNNEGPWANLENEARNIARTGKELFIISGGTFSAGSRIVGNDMVVVPDQTFKVIVVLDQIGQGPEAVTASTRVIAVVMPNDDALISKSADWRSFRVSVDQIEAMTGYDFLSDVDPAVQAVIEARVDNQ